MQAPMLIAAACAVKSDTTASKQLSANERRRAAQPRTICPKRAWRKRSMGMGELLCAAYDDRLVDRREHGLFGPGHAA